MTLGSDGEALWGVANPLQRTEFPRESNSPAQQLTVVRYSEGEWTQVVGSQSQSNPFTTFIAENGSLSPEQLQLEAQNLRAAAIAPEPESQSAWLAVSAPSESQAGSTPPARVERLESDGVVAESETLPSSLERSAGIEATGSATKLICPEREDCWMVTSGGWLYHYASPATRSLAPEKAPGFESLITERPADEGIPQVQPDKPPPDNSGYGEETHREEKSGKGRKHVKLFSSFRTVFEKPSTLIFEFRVAVPTRIQMLGLRGHRVVARTRVKVFSAGAHKLVLKLDPKHWPKRFELKSHALRPLPFVRSGR